MTTMLSRIVLSRGLALAIVTMVAAVPVCGQTLGKVARDSEAKRKTNPSSGKVYTNGDLRGDPTPPSQPAPPPTSSEPAATPPSQSGTPAADEKAKQEPAKDEATWRQRIKTERDALSRAEMFAAALQSQINGLQTEFAACQSGPQCNEVSGRRQKSTAELERVKKEIADRTKAVATIQEEARKAGVPPGWVR